MYTFPTPTTTVIMTTCTHSHQLLSQSSWRHVPNHISYYHSYHDVYHHAHQTYEQQNTELRGCMTIHSSLLMEGWDDCWITWRKMLWWESVNEWLRRRGWPECDGLLTGKNQETPAACCLFRQCTRTCETRRPKSHTLNFRANCGKTLRSYYAKPISVVRLFVVGNERPVW